MRERECTAARRARLSRSRDNACVCHDATWGRETRVAYIWHRGSLHSSFACRVFCRHASWIYRLLPLSLSLSLSLSPTTRRERSLPSIFRPLPPRPFPPAREESLSLLPLGFVQLYLPVVSLELSIYIYYMLLRLFSPRFFTAREQRRFSTRDIKTGNNAAAEMPRNSMIKWSAPDRRARPLLYYAGGNARLRLRFPSVSHAQSQIRSSRVLEKEKRMLREFTN